VGLLLFGWLPSGFVLDGRGAGPLASEPVSQPYLAIFIWHHHAVPLPAGTYPPGRGDQQGEMDMFRTCSFGIALCFLALSSGRAADDKGVSVGDAAPSFEASDDTGKPWKSSDHYGKKIVVVYFYPADFTGGCTKQACGFRDDLSKLTDKGVEVVGISGDSAKTHEAFKKFHKLNFTLLADDKGEVGKKFGVPVGKGGTAKAKIDGAEQSFERGVTIQRWTFIVGKDGKIAFKNDKVNAAEDSKKIIDAVDKLK
jgi:peroxiredoxin Q/BCP